MTVISQSDDREAAVGQRVTVAATYADGPDKGVMFFKSFTPEQVGRHVLNIVRNADGVVLEVESPKEDEARIIIDVYPSGLEDVQ